MTGRALTALLLVSVAAATAGCPRATGPCSAATGGTAVVYAQCDVDPTETSLLWHSKRHTSLGERFGPFLTPWTAIRALLDLFRDDGWSGPVLEEDPEERPR